LSVECPSGPIGAEGAEGAAVWRRIVKAIEALLALDSTGAII
jgi:hypothetical protein